MRKIKRYGWHPDLPDHRDRLYLPPHIEKLPDSVDLRPQCPPVYDQGQLGSCTANAIAAAIQFDLMRQGQEVFNPSRLFVYYNERDIEGTTDTDSGAQIRDGIKVIASLGDCPEIIWPYDIAQFAAKPSQAAYDSAIKYQALSYDSVADDLLTLQQCLADGFPFVFGFTVYQSFESEDVAKTGIAHMPAQDEPVIGGHAVMAVGYDAKAETFLIRNSWGTEWGQAGYFTLPFDYLTWGDLADDFWTIRVVK